VAQNESPKGRTRGLLFREVDGELLVHDPEAGRTFCLDRPAATILKYCDGVTPVPALLQRVRGDVGESFPEESLWVGLEELKQRNLIEPQSLPATKYHGLTRRAMLRQLGVAAATAPLIIAVVANPASAQSGPQCQPANNAGSDSPPGCACQGTFDCCGICAQGSCTGAPRAADFPGDPGAAPICFPGLVCFPADNSGNNSAPGCPCFGTFDCCGICAGGTCSGSPRSAFPPGDPGAAPICFT
jgi:hypothetical protein